jgi:hypothetical protein
MADPGSRQLTPRASCLDAVDPKHLNETGGYGLFLTGRHSREPSTGILNSWLLPTLPRSARLPVGRIARSGHGAARRRPWTGIGRAESVARTPDRSMMLAIRNTSAVAELCWRFTKPWTPCGAVSRRDYMLCYRSFRHETSLASFSGKLVGGGLEIH